MSIKKLLNIVTKKKIIMNLQLQENVKVKLNFRGYSIIIKEQNLDKQESQVLTLDKTTTKKKR